MCGASLAFKANNKLASPMYFAWIGLGVPRYQIQKIMTSKHDEYGSLLSSTIYVLLFEAIWEDGGLHMLDDVTVV